MKTKSKRTRRSKRRPTRQVTKADTAAIRLLFAPPEPNTQEDGEPKQKHTNRSDDSENEDV